MRRDVEVLHEGRWVAGTLLDAYPAGDGRWWAVVRYTTAPGMTYQQARDQGEVRAVPSA